MNTAAKPMRTTLVFGLACGLLAFFPDRRRARWTCFSHVLFQGLVWTCLAVYGILLARWSQTPLSRVVFPLALPLLLLLFHSPPQAFFLFCLVVLSWTRSGTCFPNTLAAGLATETCALLRRGGPGRLPLPALGPVLGPGDLAVLPGAVPVFPDSGVSGSNFR